MHYQSAQNWLMHYQPARNYNKNSECNISDFNNILDNHEIMPQICSFTTDDQIIRNLIPFSHELKENAKVTIENNSTNSLASFIWILGVTYFSSNFEHERLI